MDRVTREEAVGLLWLVKLVIKNADMDSCVDIILKKQRRLAIGFYLSVIAGLVTSMAKNREITVEEFIDEMLSLMFKEEKIQ